MCTPRLALAQAWRGVHKVLPRVVIRCCYPAITCRCNSLLHTVLLRFAGCAAAKPVNCSAPYLPMNGLMRCPCTSSCFAHFAFGASRLRCNRPASPAWCPYQAVLHTIVHALNPFAYNIMMRNQLPWTYPPSFAIAAQWFIATPRSMQRSQIRHSHLAQP